MQLVRRIGIRRPQIITATRSSDEAVYRLIAVLETGLIDLMIGAYLSGADVTKLSCDGEISRKTRANVRDFLQVYSRYGNRTR